MSQECAQLVDKQHAYIGLDEEQEFFIDLINCAHWSIQFVGSDDDTEVLVYASSNGEDFTLISTLDIGPTGGDGADYWLSGIGYYTDLKVVVSPVNASSDLLANVLVLGAAE